jgi:hypothetical protein
MKTRSVRHIGIFVARPLGLVLTAGGTALWLVSTVHLAAGNANETAKRWYWARG